jgi:hypothetical protein
MPTERRDHPHLFESGVVCKATDSLGVWLAATRAAVDKAATVSGW